MPDLTPNENSLPEIRVLVVGDIRLYRDGLTQLLQGSDRVNVVGCANSQEGAIDGVGRLQPHVVLIDLSMPQGLTAIRAIATAYPNIKVVALGVPEVERSVVECAEAGVVGYVPREGSLDDLISALDAVVRGELRCSPKIAATLLRRIAKLASDRRPTPQGIHLTPRELEILTLIDTGSSNKQIASDLGIEVATVKNHVHNILDKLQVTRRGEAAARMRSRLPRKRGIPTR